MIEKKSQNYLHASVSYGECSVGAFVALFSFAFKMDFSDTCLVGISLREESIDGSQESELAARMLSLHLLPGCPRERWV